MNSIGIYLNTEREVDTILIFSNSNIHLIHIVKIMIRIMRTRIVKK